jgi:hypothetical protein
MKYRPLIFATLVSFVRSSALTSDKNDSRRIPIQIPYQELVTDPMNRELQKKILHAFETVGMLSITQIPNLNKEKVMNSLPSCLSSVGSKYTLSDGTVRHTLAFSSPSDAQDGYANSMDEAFTKGQTTVESCETLKLLQAPFRSTVDDVVKKVAEFLESALSLQHMSLLQIDSDPRVSLTIADIIQTGEHLDHFHAYYSYPSLKNGLTNVGNNVPKTIEWHTDQGLLLAFSPGQVNGIPTNGFYIQLPDGTIEMVKFQREDDIVIFFGDGVNQIINPILKQKGKTPLRVLPHALKWSAADSTVNLPRTWYGRMILPPSQARHPLYPSFTFGDIRRGMIQHMNEDFVSLGCSSLHAHARLLGNSDKMGDCDETSSAYCWHSCMNFTEYDASPDLCASRKLQFGCVNEQGEQWPDVHDPQYELRCVKTIVPTTTNETVQEIEGDDEAPSNQNHSTVKKNDDLDDKSMATNHWKSAKSSLVIFMMTTLLIGMI